MRKALAVVAAAAPVGVGHHRLSLHEAQRDRLRVRAQRCRDRDDAADALGRERGEQQRLHAAQRRARRRVQPLDAEVVEQRELRAHHVADGEDREVGGVGPARARIGRRGPRAPVAAAEQIAADHEEAIGVDRETGADELLPPARARIARVTARVRRRRQPGVEQHRVVARGRELAPRLVRDREPGQLTAPVAAERLRVVEGGIARHDAVVVRLGPFVTGGVRHGEWGVAIIACRSNRHRRSTVPDPLRTVDDPPSRRFALTRGLARRSARVRHEDPVPALDREPRGQRATCTRSSTPTGTRGSSSELEYLALPGTLTPPRATYVVWAESQFGRQILLGRLAVAEDRSAEWEGTVPFESSGCSSPRKTSRGPSARASRTWCRPTSSRPTRGCGSEAGRFGSSRRRFVRPGRLVCFGKWLAG